MTTDNSGNVYAAGHYEDYSVKFGSIVLGNTSVMIDNGFLVKYDVLDTAVWARKIEGNLDVNMNGNWSERCNGISADQNGNVFVTGYFQSASVTFGPTTIYRPGSNLFDAFFAKYDTNGNALWAKSTGGSALEMGTCATTYQHGNVYF